MNHKIKGMVKWLDTFYGKKVVSNHYNIRTDPFKYFDYIDDYDNNGDYHNNGITISSFKFLYSKITTELDVHKDVWADMENYFDASINDCEIAIKQWFGNKFNVRIVSVSYWET